MKHIVSAFSMLAVLILNLMVGTVLLSVSAKAAEAKEYKAEVVAEIENSNFNPHVIADCIRRASERGYELTVNRSIYDERTGDGAAEVLLEYGYELPLFGIAEKKVTRGIAR